MYIVIYHIFRQRLENIFMDEKGPHTKPDKVRGGLHGGLTNQRAKVITQAGLKLKLSN